MAPAYMRKLQDTVFKSVKTIKQLHRHKQNRSFNGLIEFPTSKIHFIIIFVMLKDSNFNLFFVILSQQYSKYDERHKIQQL